MNKSQIVTAVINRSARPELQAEIESDYLALGEARIGRDLETLENQNVADITPTSNSFELPEDLAKLVSVEYLEDRGPRTLVSRDVHTINKFSEQGGTPHFYYMRGPVPGTERYRLDVRPFIAGTYRVTYFNRGSLAQDGDSSMNAVSVRYPNLYIYATLLELYIAKRDAVQRDVALAAYTDDLRQANKSARRARSDKPAMRRA